MPNHGIRPFLFSAFLSAVLRLIIIGMLLFSAQALFCQAAVLGDVNRDNTVNIIDALLVAQYNAGLPNITLTLSLADVNASGTVDIVDALLIAQYAGGLVTRFPGQTVTPTPTPTATGGIYSFTGTLPNGLIDGAQVAYTTTAGLDGTNVRVTFDGGAGFEWVWLYTPDYHALTNTSGTLWSVSLSGYTQGSTLQYYFTVRKNGQEANNNSAQHVWTVGGPASTPTPTATPTRTPTPLVTVTPTPTTPAGYTLVWSDEFTSSIGPDWVFETGNGSGGWGNNELEYYRRENASSAGGALVIEAKKESYSGFNYTSARMKTEGRRSWQYGRIEARIKLSLGQGIWPAFWLLGDNISTVNWPACGEIDIMEHINTEATVYGTIHWDSNGHASYTGSTGVNPADYHIYAIEWNDKAIKWYVDGSLYHEANIENNINSTEEFHRKFFILLNVAVGGNWPGAPAADTAFPAYMYVDYVRVYQ